MNTKSTSSCRRLCAVVMCVSVVYLLFASEATRCHAGAPQHYDFAKDKEARILQDFAIGLLKRNFGEPEEARNYLQKSMAESAEPSPALLTHLAAVTLELGNKDEARRLLEAAVRLDAHDERARFILAFAYISEDKADEAITIFQDILADNPESIPVLNALSELLISKNDTDGARVLYERLIELGAATIRSYYNLGVIYLRSGDVEKAAENFEKVVTINPEDIKSHFALASIYDRLGNEERAIDELERIYTFEPDNKDVCSALASLYAAEGDYGKAIFFLEKVSELDPVDIDAYINLGILWLRSGDPEKARQALVAAEKLDANRPDLCLYMGMTYETVGEYEPAVEQYTKCLEVFKKKEVVYFHLGSLYDRLGDFEKAEEFFERTLARDPAHHIAMNYLAYMYAVKGKKLNKAEDLVKKALELNPEEAAYIDTLGWVYFKKGNFKKARISLEDALRREPLDREILEHVVAVYDALGMKEEAAAYRARIVEHSDADAVVRGGDQQQSDNQEAADPERKDELQ